MAIREITVHELKAWQEAGKDLQLIDVREPHEFDIVQMGGTLIPMAEAVADPSAIRKEGDVVIHCRSGARSANVVRALQERYGYTNLYNLKGGILAWADEIDPSLPKY